MLQTIMGIAEGDERIRVYAMEGSRTNPAIEPDQYQDFDISFFVDDYDSFLADESWLDSFGTIVFMQKPEDMELFPPEMQGFSYLMTFDDGQKIDLTIYRTNQLDAYLESEPLARIMLDKDGIAPADVQPTDQSFWVQRPSPRSFDECCNEFWHCTTYVAKGLCRREFLYAAALLNENVRNELIRMLSWQVGFETDFSLSVGKKAKFLERYVVPYVWGRLCQTFAMATYDQVWDALFTATQLFTEASHTVAGHLGCAYPSYEAAILPLLQQRHQECQDHE